MNEYIIIKKSVKVAGIGLIIFTITSIITSNVSYMLGFLLGYGINLATFYVIIQTSALILELQAGTIGLVSVLYFVKLLLYGVGFFLAFNFPTIFSPVGVLIGYFIVKVTIYIQTYRNRGGDVDG
ncbi:hypothetical protein [Tannockella kyphosi]|uniref:hypothetical protein n=1 Tax=Tannockella kyphosi TaxID=2899121 RepID=UPI0020131B81|nr:hypothetical protein [Tannockella kyphosi]